MRNHYNHEELEAARILDLVRLGDETVPCSIITWALFVLGDAIGCQ